MNYEKSDKKSSNRISTDLLGSTVEENNKKVSNNLSKGDMVILSEIKKAIESNKDSYSSIDNEGNNENSVGKNKINDDKHSNKAESNHKDKGISR